MNDADGSWPAPSGPTLEQVKETIASLEATEAAATPGLDTEQRRRKLRRGRVALDDRRTASDVLSEETEVPSEDSAVDTQPAPTAAVVGSRVAWVVAATGLVLLLWGAKQVLNPAATARLAGGMTPAPGMTGRQRLEPPPQAHPEALAPPSEPSQATAERQSSSVVAQRDRRESPAAPVTTLRAAVEPSRPPEPLKSPSIPVIPSVPALPAPRNVEPSVVPAPDSDTAQESITNSPPIATTPSVASAVLPALPNPATTVTDSRGAATANTNVIQPENTVRAVLEGYRTAYNQLNASDARALWPSVDFKTLSKAFDQLQSQEIRFTNCQIALTGESASAVCAGYAAFVPKVGSRERRSTSREWKFALRHSTDGWVIAGVDMR
jgi:hypothetical protein